MTDSANTYLFSRSRRASEWVSDDPNQMVGMMFFNLWSHRQQPYLTLADGDNMLLLDTTTRRLIWHLRATAVTKKGYDSIPEALDIIRVAFGLIPDNLSNHWDGRPDHGYVLAWAVDVIQPLNIKMYDGFKMSRNGYLPFDKIPSGKRPTIPSFDPSKVVGRPIAYVGGIDLREPGSRYIPQSVRNEVRKRDRGQCVTCRRKPPEVELHYDHMWPFSRGGTNNADNIQLLCAEHNLRKSAAVLDGATPPPDLTLRQAIAAKFGLDGGSSLSDIIDTANLTTEQTTELLLDEAVYGDVEDVDRAVTDRPGLPKHDLIRASVGWGFKESDKTLALSIANELMNSPDPDAATKAALLKWEVDDDATTDLLESAMASKDPETRSLAAFHLGIELGGDDEPRSADYFRIAVSDGIGSLRAAAALEILEGETPVVLAVAFDLLAIARTSDDPRVANLAVALTGRAMLLDERPAEALTCLVYVEHSDVPEAIERAAEIREEFDL